ncbi:ribosome-associated translation inhibitor RaiA [Hazenella sp. IB182357]|uniref:Ribosome hibernation promoting factor n=1 Tax=Polycladospora coralii TaxID=2771432 RepID=A0A926RX52_9BACL|nr:ribosome-associated translation inhibitor RaiA [Polycladospora coralii]MBD1372196.1 ribosome-associated translation inhibitor RaiA [Polycladospora coralii]MBS7530695.1 ribosome-associated translation inhibitor RaiA [Polycladospora coralii]
MKYVIRGNNIEVTEPLHDYVEKKIGRLEKYFDSPPAAEAQILLSVINKEEHRVEVTIPFPGFLVRAEESSRDMYASIDNVVEKLERQIRKYKTKVNRKARQDASNRKDWIEQASTQITSTAVIDEEDDEFEIVKTKRFNLKPMVPEEAILQMDLLGHNFFVFSNANNDEVSIIYKRKDGRYGLIEPE